MASSTANKKMATLCSSSEAFTLAPSTHPSFPAFKNLPPELRNYIWELSLPGPRLINVRADSGTILINKRSEGKRYFNHVWASKTPVPAILQICQESREAGLKHYELIFDSNQRPCKVDFPDIAALPPPRGCRVENSIFAFEGRAMIYVGLERDVIVTAHKRLGTRWYSVDKAEQDPMFQRMPIAAREFKLAVFRAAVPRSVFERIKYFVATYTLGIHELFPGRYGTGMATDRNTVAILYPFQRRMGEEKDLEEDDDEKYFGGNCGRDFINCLTRDWNGFPVSRDGRVSRLFHRRDLTREVEDGLRDGTLFVRRQSKAVQSSNSSGEV